MKQRIGDTRKTLAVEIKDLKNSQAEIKKCYNWDAKLTECNESEERIGDIEDKIMENNEAEKRGRKNY